MDPDFLFLWDLCGYYVVRGVLSAADVRDANAAVDASVARAVDAGAAVASDELDAQHGVARHEKHRVDVRGMLGWPEDERQPFTSMIAHPKLAPYLNALCGRGFRMDHPPTLVTQDRGSPLGILHDMRAGQGFHPSVYYHWQDGQMYNGLVVAAVQLTDVGRGEGGLAVVPGTHKSNVDLPEDMKWHKRHTEHIKQVETRAGDVVLFSEATVHGTLAWSGRTQRRSALFRYSPANLAFAGGRHAFDSEHRSGDAWPAAWYDGLSDAARAVLEPPYDARLERPVLGDDGELTAESQQLIEGKGWAGIGKNGDAMPSHRTINALPPPSTSKL